MDFDSDRVAARVSTVHAGRLSRREGAPCGAPGVARRTGSVRKSRTGRRRACPAAPGGLRQGPGHPHGCRTMRHVAECGHAVRCIVFDSGLGFERAKVADLPAQLLRKSPLVEVVMKRKKSKVGRQRIAHEAEGVAAGALAGAALGSAAGPPGIAAGAVIGGLAGVISGAVLDSESSRRASRSRELDAQIGVIGGDLGAPNLKHPPAERGAYSAASVGVDSSSGEEPAEGPMQVPER